jgi:outer membrane protein assembly factor BamA
LLLCLHAAPLAAAPRAAIRLPAGLIISSIKIETHDVFETDSPPENKLLYRAANGIHIQTRDTVIERELLFAVGDRYNAALVAETERNLRLLPFIRHAEAEAKVNKNGGVDVIMRTYDSWTLEVIANFKRAGGVASGKAGFADHNLLGWGKTVSAVYSRDGGSASKSAAWKDPQFLGRKHLEYSMRAESSPGSASYSLALNRPFYASIAHAAFGCTANYAENTASTYSGETSVGTVRKDAGEAGISYGIAIATSTERTRHVKLGLLTRHAHFRAITGEPSGPIPESEQLSFLQLGGDWEELDFITVRRIQRFTHDEDYNLGFGVFPTVSWAPDFRPLSTTESQILPGIIMRKGFTWSQQLLLLNSGYSSKYVNGGNGNRIASLGASYFVRGIKYQTLAFHTSLDLGWHLDPAAPLTLGEVNGLRGYGLSQFSGSRRFLFNIEDRIFIWDELWRLLDVGAVAFYDSGYVWPSSSSIKLADLKNSVGVGLRLAPSRSGSNDPVRIDLAYALSSNQSRSRWSLSILAGQAFGP